MVRKKMKRQIKTVTHENRGHMLHHNNVFSKNEEWIVFDGRNDDTKIGETATIGVVHLSTGEEHTIYQTENQTVYGPGVGAASFSPVSDRVLFIHGLRYADSVKPYDITRRTGLSVDLDKPLQGIYMDARDVQAPYVPGSLRGGTHSHCWSGDGLMISFTYNDEFVDPDLRTVGVMVPQQEPAPVSDDKDANNGLMYAAIITDVVRDPRNGSDEIAKAFDECWIGEKGYTDPVGRSIEYAIAFQGHTKNQAGEVITEIFVVDVDERLIKADISAVGLEGEGPRVPKGIKQRRLSHTIKGLSDLRHWLRSSSDGQYIYALAKDDKDRNQIVQCHTDTGEFSYISSFDFSVSSPINVSYRGDKITFVADNNVYLFEIPNKELVQLTPNDSYASKIIGAPVFSRKDDKIAFNQFETIDGNTNVHIKLIQI